LREEKEEVQVLTWFDTYFSMLIMITSFKIPT